MQVSMGTLHMREQCVHGTFFSSPHKQDSNVAVSADLSFLNGGTLL